MNENLKIWFTIGSVGTNLVYMHSGVIDANFNPDSLLFENQEYNEKTGEWETTWTHNAPDYCYERIRLLCNPKTLIPALENAYIFKDYKSHPITHDIGVCIKGVFDMNDKNEYGIAKNIWD